MVILTTKKLGIQSGYVWRKGGKISNSRVDRKKELPLVCPHSGVGDPLAELRVFVDQPSLPQYVGRCVLQLKVNCKIRIFANYANILSL